LYVLGDRHPLLAKGLELAANMTNFGAALRAVEPMHDGPYIHGRRATDELERDDWLHGAEEETEDPLVCDPPAGVLRVGNVHCRIAGALLDDLVWGRCGAIEVPM
jgi:hypothetical protein